VGLAWHTDALCPPALFFHLRWVFYQTKGLKMPPALDLTGKTYGNLTQSGAPVWDNIRLAHPRPSTGFGWEVAAGCFRSRPLRTFEAFAEKSNDAQLLPEADFWATGSPEVFDFIEISNNGS
jgi:hypothetical protein